MKRERKPSKNKRMRNPIFDNPPYTGAPVDFSKPFSLPPAVAELISWGLGVFVDGLVCRLQGHQEKLEIDDKEVLRKRLDIPGIAICEHGVYQCPKCQEKNEREEKKS